MRLNDKMIALVLGSVVFSGYPAPGRSQEPTPAPETEEAVASAKQDQPSSAPQDATTGGGEKALTNEDVIRLSALDLGDEVVTAKIRQAATVNFALDVDSVAKLKEQGVSKAAIAAMLERTTSKPQEPAAAPVASSGMPAAGTTYGGIVLGSSVLIRTSDSETELRSIAGSMSTTYAFVTALAFADFPGLAAEVRTKDRRPSFIVKSQQSPVGRYFLVKAEPDRDDGVRSVKLGRSGMFGAKQMGNPDRDWQVQYDAVQEQPGTWRITPTSNLSPGEYGIWLRTEELYDFGVDA